MFETIDNYCERIGDGFWAEPLNAITNLAFILAAFFSWRLMARLNQSALGNWVLVLLLFSIGVGSGLFHTFATRWAELADIIPIVLFQLAYLWLYSRNVIRLKGMGAAGLLVAFVAILAFGFMLNASLGERFEALLAPLNGSGMYAGALIGVYGLGIYHLKAQTEHRAALLLAALLFTFSLLFRTLDMGLCNQIPFGTHFLWHMCNAGVLYLSIRAYLYSQ